MPPRTIMTNSQARQNRGARRRWRRLLVSPQSPTPVNAVDRIAATLSRFASTQQTAFDTGAAPQTTAVGASNLLERQVQRAMTQVLGRTPGRGSGSFMGALNATFPITADGRVCTTPMRSIVSMYTPNGNTPSTPPAPNGAGLSGQISVEQATLYRATSIIIGDAISVLQGLQPFLPDVDINRVNSLRSLILAEFQSLIDEFGRSDEPRFERVNVILQLLTGPNNQLDELGRAALLAPGPGFTGPVTEENEAQIAGFDLIRSYVTTIAGAWNNYLTQVGTRSQSSPRLFGDRLQRASNMLPIIAEVNTSFMSAMDSIGFGEGERRSEGARFDNIPIGTLPSSPTVPGMTINDLNEWLERFASIEGPTALADSGIYGLGYVTDQADQLFFEVVSILQPVRLPVAFPPSGRTALANQVLNHERVSYTLDDLLVQLDELAKLAA